MIKHVFPLLAIPLCWKYLAIAYYVGFLVKEICLAVEGVGPPFSVKHV